MSFPSRQLHLDGWGHVLISTCALQDQLLDKARTNYKDSAAQIIDEKVFYFVEQTQLLMPQKTLSKILERELNL